MASYGYYQSPIGLIKITADEASVLSLEFIETKVNQEALNSNNLVINNCLEQLDQYFKQDLTTFDLPLAPKGTKFQELVWKETLKIPYNQAITYQELAQKINHPKACRAVGSALGKNPLAIFIPCHRVVSRNKKIINYSSGKERKIFLQTLESLQQKK